MITNAIRWWFACSFRRTPVARIVDRIDAWVLIASALVAIAAVYPAAAIGHAGYAVRSRGIAAEAAARHPVQATAVRDSTPDPALIESAPATFVVPVRWTVQGAMREDTARVDQPVKAGDQVGVWLTTEGSVTSPPPTDSDARVAAIGTAALSWLAAMGVIGAILVGLRRITKRSRDREWNRGLWALVDDAGGASTHRP